MSIADLADKYIGFTGGANLSKAGRNCQRITDAVGDESSSSSLIATIFWQAFMNSPAYLGALRRTEITSRAINDGQRFILRHGVERLPRYDLVIFDPGFGQSEPSAIQIVNVSPSQLREGWNAFISSNKLPFRSSAILAVINNGREAVVEALKVQEFGLMVTAPLSRQYTALLPAPAMGIAHRIEPSICTIGVIAKDVKGREGATTALHSLDPKKSKVFVQGLPGVVKAQDKNNVTDSCFIEIPGILSSHLPQSQYVSGPLRGMPPGTNGPVSFERENVEESTHRL